MKLQLLLWLLIYLAIPICANAQIDFGIKSGLNLADVVINNFSNPDLEPAYQIKPGVHAGFYFSVEGDNEVGLAAELLYSNKGVNAINNINLHYVCIPLLVRYHFHDHFFAEAGPEVGYLVNANSKYGNLNSTWDNKLDIGLDAGLQYRPGKIHFGLRFNAGFSSVIRTTSSGINGERVRYLNRVAQISVAIPIKQLPY
jgi:hypothetical protein